MNQIEKCLSVNLDEDLPSYSANGSASTPGVSAELNQRTASASTNQDKFQLYVACLCLKKQRHLTDFLV